MAMALTEKNTHYHWHTIQRRHFIDTAKAVRYSEKRAENLLNEMLNKTDLVIQEVSRQLPPTFPKQIANTIFAGLKNAALKLSVTP